MNEFEKNMEQIFDIEVTADETEIIVEKPAPPAKKEDPEKDYEYTRKSYKPFYRCFNKTSSQCSRF